MRPPIAGPGWFHCPFRVQMIPEASEPSQSDETTEVRGSGSRFRESAGRAIAPSARHMRRGFSLRSRTRGFGLVAVALTPRRKPELSHPRRPPLRFNTHRGGGKGTSCPRPKPRTRVVHARIHLRFPRPCMAPPTHLHHAPRQARYIRRITPCHPVIRLDSDGYAEAEGDNLLCPARPCDGGKLVARRCSTTVPFILSPPGNLNRQVLSQLITCVWITCSYQALPFPHPGDPCTPTRNVRLHMISLGYVWGVLLSKNPLLEVSSMNRACSALLV